MNDYDLWISIVLENLGLLLLILAIIISLIEGTIQKFIKRASSYEVLYRWIALLPLGVTAIYAFSMHAFFPQNTAKILGWPNSPFQLEVAVADLAFGIMAILSFRASFGFKLATVIGSTIWLWGDAIVQVCEMMGKDNFSLSNAGPWFLIDLLIPLLLILCILKMKSRPSEVLVVPRIDPHLP